MSGFIVVFSVVSILGIMDSVCIRSVVISSNILLCVICEHFLFDSAHSPSNTSDDILFPVLNLYLYLLICCIYSAFEMLFCVSKVTPKFCISLVHSVFTFRFG